MIVVVDLGMGNLGSVPNCCKRVGYQAVISADPAVVAAAEKIILPGVGAFDMAMKEMHSRGLYSVLQRRVVDDKVPILGICLGMQLLFEDSDEGEEVGMSWLPGRFTRFPAEYNGKRLWSPTLDGTRPNRVKARVSSPMYRKTPSIISCIPTVSLKTREDAVASTTDYGGSFVSGVESGRIMGAELHPEKSHQFGAQLVKNFLSMD